MNEAYDRAWSMEYENEAEAEVDFWALPLRGTIGKRSDDQ